MKLFFGIFATLLCASKAQSDYLDAPPVAVYGGDYDALNKMFPAHSGWLNDFEIHYYKFRIFAPPSYPEVIVSRHQDDSFEQETIH